MNQPSRTIQHVLFDADGVIQDLPGGWYAAMEPFLGTRARPFLDETWVEELPALSGVGDYLPLLAARLEAYDVTAPVDVIYTAVWHRISLIEESIGLISQLRSAGYGVHLGTNQERHRGEYMKVALGYDQLFDVSCYSYELGAAKPARHFFLRATERIGAKPEAILFVDDNEENVEAARKAGLAAEHWHFEQGHPELLTLLSRHGVRPASAEADS